MGEWPERVYAWFDKNGHLRTGLSKRGKASEFRTYIPEGEVSEPEARWTIEVCDCHSETRPVDACYSDRGHINLRRVEVAPAPADREGEQP